MGMWQLKQHNIWSTTVFMLSLAGVPPLVGFTGKFYIFSEFTWVS